MCPEQFIPEQVIYDEVVIFETKNISITMVFRIHNAIKFDLSARKRLREERVFMKKRNFR